MQPIPKETALSIVLSSRSYGPSTVVESTPTPRVEAKTFRELFCASLQNEPAPSPGRTNTSGNTQGYSIKSNNTKDTGTQTEGSTESVLPIAQEDPSHNPGNSKTTKATRWADDNTHVDYELKALYSSRSCDQKDAPRRMRTYRGKTRHYSKRERNQRWAQDEFKEAPQEPPRVNFDWKEFEREVRENNLKTLKDSRWA
ncbi:hypothetical protein F4860DRAFT_463603 [Xylaria cubensis]|nr:hypothetical protein F4860DRAFT_463603 [Xylaria cubensis]